ncbi:ribonucleotide reductase inhibitor-domain-containing protein [Microdochium bolleyi]|uniref:Ribonucleotide reductase inhibitor-domain-containing protein n=1 Tax=Microdochium bolleyi TaxID=196109 RepID=A0A136JAI5_9PEZI|nr:ribonucleotide reductase inhibitor-domain-containing protein [Microdochium bolleyi]
MSAPRTKRQFAGAASDPAQRQITSFFNSATGTPADSLSHISGHAATTHTSPSPSLPASVQSNLISVGMRVRKSVPEGYKTGTYSAFSLWDDASTTRKTTPTPTYTAAAPSSPERHRSRANAFSTPRELLPFCGIHRVGGLDVQPGWESANAFSIVASSNNDNPVDDFDDLPGLTSSQESALSTDSWATDEILEVNNTRKRFFVDEEEAGAVSARSLAPMGWDNGRVIAVPKKLRARGKPTSTSSEMGLSTTLSAQQGGAKLDQENVMIMDADFGEAEFLDQQKTWEVAMSDA